MKAKSLLFLGLATGLLALGGWKAFSHFSAAASPAAKVQHWVCPMRCLGKVYDQPGKCPVCHMKLNPIGEPNPPRAHISPWEELGGKTAVYFRPYTVRKVQADTTLRVAGRMKGTRLTARLPAGGHGGLKAGLSVMIMPPQGYSRPAFGSVISVGPGEQVTIRSPRAFPAVDYALAEIRLPARETLAVPIEALTESDGKAKVFIRRGEAYLPLAVSVTSRGESYASVSGLSEGDVVAGDGVFWLEAQWRMDHPSGGSAAAGN